MSAPKNDTDSVNHPFELELKNWLTVLKKALINSKEGNLNIVSAGVAFYAFLGIFPLLSVFISLFSLFFEANDLSELPVSIQLIFPAGVLQIFEEQLQRLALKSNQQVGIALLLSTSIALISGTKAVTGFISGLNMVLKLKEKRSIFQVYLTATLFAQAGLILFVSSIFLISVLPSLLDYFYLSGIQKAFSEVARWILLYFGVVLSLSVVFRWGPSAEIKKWKWITPGTSLAALLWLIVSAGFSFYSSNFASYDTLYGPIGTIVVFLFWIFLSCYSFLFGAEIDKVLLSDWAQGSSPFTSGSSQPEKKKQ